MSEVAIELMHICKTYRIWSTPASRLLVPTLKQLSRVVPGMPGRAMARKAQAGFRDVHAINDVSFTVERGEALGIIGRNGSGKSTLLQILAGTLQPTSGTFILRGRVAALLELGSGFNPEFTGRENVLLNAALYGLTGKEAESRFDDIAAFADIGDFINEPVKTYSSGMALRLAFSVIVHIDADILIVDEALAVGDVFFVQKCMRWLKRFRERGTLLFVTHNAADLTSLCDRAVWLRDGRLEMFGDAKTVSENYLAFFNQWESGVKPTRPQPATGAGQGPPAPRAAYDRKSQIVRRAAENPDFRVFEFDPDAEGFGTGEAEIIGVELLDTGGRKLPTIEGGEVVDLVITARAHAPIDDIILGFYLKNRIGQYLFGENTHLSTRERQISAQPGDVIEAVFRFQMPLLPTGAYVITPAIASGDLLHHVQHHWIHEALVIESSQRYVHRGLVALPMISVELAKRPTPSNQPGVT